MTSGGSSERAICVATVPPLLWRLLGNDNNSKKEFGDVGPKFQCKELRVMVQKQRTEAHNTMEKKQPYLDRGGMSTPRRAQQGYEIMKGR